MSKPTVGEQIKYVDQYGNTVWTATVVDPPQEPPNSLYRSSNVIWIQYRSFGRGANSDYLRELGEIVSCSLDPWWTDGSLRRVSPLEQLAEAAVTDGNE